MTATLNGQWSGYWYKEDEIPPSKPKHGPNGGVIQSSERNGVVLDLVQVNGQWRPMTEPVMYSYLHSNALVNGKPMCFVPLDERWPTKYLSALETPISREEVRRIYGPGIIRRMRPGERAVQIRLSRKR